MITLTKTEKITQLNAKIISEKNRLSLLIRMENVLLDQRNYLVLHGYFFHVVFLEKNLGDIRFIIKKQNEEIDFLEQIKSLY